MVKKHIVPTILVKSRKALLDKLKKVSSFVSRVQIDIIDGKFADNKTIGLKSLKGIRAKPKLEIHLMVKDVDSYVYDCINLKPYLIIFHIESCKNAMHAKELIKRIKKSKIKAGIALNPKTSASKVKPFLRLVNQVLVMTVKPGWGGQEFMPKMLPKILQIRNWNKNVDIEVDGGIDIGIACLCANAGANVFAAGGAIYKAKNIKKAIQQLKDDVRCMM